MPFKVDQLIQDVTEYMQDEPQLNVLLNKREFSPGMHKIAVKMMVAAFNRVNFVSNYTPLNFPDATEDIQIWGTVYNLLNSAAILQVRNHLAYNDAGLSIAQFSKSGEYSGVADRFEALFEKGALSIKYNINIAMGMGGILSEYSYFGGWATVYGHSFST